MFDLFRSGSVSETQAQRLAKAIDQGTQIIERNSREIREVFEEDGYPFRKGEFLDVVASMFSMLILDNVKRSEHYDTKEAVSAFISEVDEEYLLYVDMDRTFEAGLSEPEKLKREAAAWGAWKYFQVKPTDRQARLFYERAKTFVEFIRNADEQQFGER